MPTPLVSVLLPVYNAAATLAEAILSIRSQTLSRWELLVTDDGSTDGSRAIVQRFNQQDPRVRLISQPRAGIVPALNAGLDQSSAPLVARMDADDLAAPDRLERQLEFLERSEEIGLVSSLVEFAGDRSRAAGYALHVDWMNSLVHPDEIALNRFIESPFAHPTVLFRRELIERLDGYRSGDFPEDYELWLRWMDAGVRMAKVPRVLLTWRDSPGRLSRTEERYRPEAFYRCKAAYLARWLTREVAPDRLILVWGAGRVTRRRADLLSAHGIQIGGYIDIDPRKIGRMIGGRPVFAPRDLPDPRSCVVLGYVGKRGARELARHNLRTRGYKEGKDFLMVA